MRWWLAHTVATEGVPRRGAASSLLLGDCVCPGGSPLRPRDARSLARLGTSIMAEIENRAGATEPSTGPLEVTAPLPSPAVVLPPPAPSDVTQYPLIHRYGDWPLAAAWMEDWPSPTPW